MSYTLVKDRTYTIYPGTESQMDYMLSRFDVQRWTKSLSLVETEYYSLDGNTTFFRNNVTVYLKVQNGEERDRAG